MNNNMNNNINAPFFDINIKSVLGQEFNYRIQGRIIYYKCDNLNELENYNVVNTIYVDLNDDITISFTMTNNDGFNFNITIDYVDDSKVIILLNYYSDFINLIRSLVDNYKGFIKGNICEYIKRDFVDSKL